MQLSPLILLLLVFGCRPGIPEGTTAAIEFYQPVEVNVHGYSGNIMEPFISRDGTILFFNNLNNPPENTNLHWATKINDTAFEYKGEITGINTNDLEAVASMDTAGNLYFVSNRNYQNTLSTIYQCNFNNGNATNVHLTQGISKLQAGQVNFDVEVSANGQELYFVDAQFNQSGNPQSADLVIAEKTGTGFKRLPDSDKIMQNINTDGLEYAACISANQLELYFTRVGLPLTATSHPEIYYSTRQNLQEAFGKPTKIAAITGFAEAPTIAPDQRTLYFHRRENNRFVLYCVKKK